MLPIIYNSSFLTLYSYPLFLGLALGVSYYFSFYLFHVFKRSEKTFFAIWWPAVFVAWIGAKLLFLLSSSGVNSISSLFVNSNFWFGGGFVFFGGLLFALCYMFLGVWRKWFSFFEITLFLPGIAWGHAVGRVGCFLAGCCYGSPSTHFDHIFLHHEFRYPVQIYESLTLFLLGIVLWKMVRHRVGSTTLFSTYILGYSLIRFALEFLRGDKIRGVWGFFSTSQIISLLLSSLVVSYLLVLKRRDH